MSLVRLYKEPGPDVIDQYEKLADGFWYPKPWPTTPWNPIDGDHMNEGVKANMRMNPKYVQAQKDGKVRMECLITSVLASEARVLAHGADKYGARNWRKDEILASTYEGAMMRHLFAWINGEDTDPDSGEPHLSHLRACAAVVMDADDHNKLVDDRDRMESKG